MKTEKNKALRGSVLFTVVAVMALLIIFMAGTLALASATSNRAHKSYASSQASYTAKAAIDGFAEAMSREDGLVAAIQDIGTNPIYPSIVFREKGETDSDLSIGRIGCYDADNGSWRENCIKIEPVNEGKEYAYVCTDATTKKYEWKEVQPVKVSATCRVGREEETVTAYIKKLGTTSQTINNPSNPPAGGSRIKGLNTAGTANMPNGGLFTGGLGIGISESIPGSFSQTNATTIETSLTYINGTYDAATSTFQIMVKGPKSDTMPRPYSEVVVNGGLRVKNNEFIDIDYQMFSDYTQKEIPYLFVNEALVFVSGGDVVKYNGSALTKSPTKDCPYNIFAGTLYDEQNPINLGAADIYLMDEYKEKQYYTIGSNQYEIGLNSFKNSGSKLYKWADSTLNKTSSGQFGSVGGNIYCMGRLRLEGTEVFGDVRVHDDLIFAGDSDITIHGDVICEGKIRGEGNALGNKKVKIEGTIYCNDASALGATSEGYAVPSYKHERASTTAPVYVDLKAESRDFVEWDPTIHNATQGDFDDQSGKYLELNGSATDSEEKLYYRYAENYAPGMKICVKKNDDQIDEVEFTYPDEAYPKDGFEEYEKDVDAVIKETVGSSTYAPGADKVTDAVISRFIDVSSRKSETDIGEEKSYNVFPKVVSCDEDGTNAVLRHTSSAMPDGAEYMYYDVKSGEYVKEKGTSSANEVYYTKGGVGADKLYFDTGTETTSKTTYYNKDRNEISEADYQALLNSGNTSGFKVSPLGDKVAYPQNMTRDAIWQKKNAAGEKEPADPSTKIVKTLKEAREDMGFDGSTGQIDAGKYNLNIDKTASDFASKYPPVFEVKNGKTYVTTDFYSDVVCPKCGKHYTVTKEEFETKWLEVDSNKGGRGNEQCTCGQCNFQSFMENPGLINKSCTLSGTIDNNTLYIQADSEIVVVLDGLTLNNANIIVKDASKELVKFNIIGNLNCKLETSIVREKIATGTAKIKYTDDWGMEFYGNPGSSITCANYSTFSGSFKAPYTTFDSCNWGKYTVAEYIDEYGQDWLKEPFSKIDASQGKPVIIGNALFSNVKDLQNCFSLYYTESGTTTNTNQGNGNGQGSQTGSGGVTYLTGLGYFELQYFGG